MTGYIKSLYIYDTQDGRNLDRTQGGLGVSLEGGLGGQYVICLHTVLKKSTIWAGGESPTFGGELDRSWTGTRPADVLGGFAAGFSI